MSDERKIPGRASSQVSIYDYPEHLNPFYEDENHKRLRFWKINSSSKGQNQKAGRSNSFSFSGLKDIWAFKSFKLKKKSSTLGINKTSESPPELRRVYPVGETYNTVDSRSQRHTYDIGLGSNFQRSGYRSSLQNVHSTGGDSNGFYRNDRYRSTIQNGSQTIATSPQRDRYVYNGSVTPTPRSRYGTPQSRYGSSQTSINSTNPFEEDDNISRCESVDGVSLRKRKKRKAPQPPVTSPAVSTNQQACTTVEEISGKEEVADISNLTAEIETFVRTHDNDQEKLQESKGSASLKKKKDKSPPIPPARISSNVVAVKPDTSDNGTVTYGQTQVTIEQVPIQTVVSESHNSRSVEQPVQSTVTVVESETIIVNETLHDETERRKIIDRKLGNSRESPENNEDYPERTSQTPDPGTEDVRLRKFNSEKKLNVNEKVVVETNVDAVQSPPRIIIRKPTEDWEYDEEIRLNGDAPQESCEDSPKTPISSEVEFILEQNTSRGGSEYNTSQNASEQSNSTSVLEHSASQSPSEQNTSQVVSEQKISQIVSENDVSQSPSDVIVNQSSSTQVSQTSSKQNTNEGSPDRSTSQSSSTIIQKRDSEAVVVETVHIEASTTSGHLKGKPAVPVKKNFENSLENFSARSHESILPESKSDDVAELKIVESTDDLSSTPSVSESPDRYKIRFVALKSFSPESQRRDVELRSHNNQEFDVEDMDLPPAPPQRRRSVKDIIASINKSQSLLKINQKPNGNAETRKTYNYDTYLPQTIPTTPAKEPLQSQPSLKSSDDSINRKYSELEESERKMRKMISDMEQSSEDVPVPVVEKFDEFLIDDGKSTDLFKKCVVRRDKNVQSGSGASQDESRSSLEWNPLPKPRRSRNLSHELENGKI